MTAIKCHHQNVNRLNRRKGNGQVFCYPVRSLMSPWSSASPHTPQPTCTSCDCLTDFKDVTIYIFLVFISYKYCWCFISKGIQKAHYLFTITVWKIHLCQGCWTHGSVGQGGCHSVHPQPPTSTKTNKPTVRTLSAVVFLSQHCLLSANFGLLSLSCLCQLIAKDFNSRSDCTRIYSPAFSPVASEHQVWKLHHCCSLI